MPNKYFRFKQFTVYQDKSAMKVGVDSVLLGAWADFYDAKNILDIGAGTGLLSLMAAQKSQAKITAVEIDIKSIEQAKENINLSPWHTRIKLIHRSFQDFAIHAHEKFDCAICNPPYFNGSYHSPSERRNTARQNNKLPLPDLFAGLNNILSLDGDFYIIYPYLQKEILINAAREYNFYPSKILEIKTCKNNAPKRVAICFTRKKIPVQIIQLDIRDCSTNQFSEEYKRLTKDFYLNF